MLLHESFIQALRLSPSRRVTSGAKRARSRSLLEADQPLPRPRAMAVGAARHKEQEARPAGARAAAALDEPAGKAGIEGRLRWLWVFG